MSYFFLLSVCSTQLKLKFELKVCRMHYVDYITAEMCVSVCVVGGWGGVGGGVQRSENRLCNFHQLL